jgi:hypothetical protein
MARSIEINTGDNYISIKKNYSEKLIILMMSLFAESLFYFLLFKNISPTVKKVNKAVYAILLLSVISIIFLALVVLSLRNFFLDKDYKIEKSGENIMVNGKDRFKRNDVRVDVNENVNRWGTKTYNVFLKGDRETLKVVDGIDENDKEYLVKHLSTFLIKLA